ncbi:hypothetical protein R1sor_014007 [Riccia sorocarpa]|uniref:NB-ARC domain-containing protein n=1 Tax=Riccia sorocarpa TaxID=122646 RepID=A0ABD3H8T2_9MARC
MYLLGESLVRSLVVLEGVGRTCPFVLVGHCLGGMVLKKILFFAESFANEERSCRSVSRAYQTFLEHVKGAFFLSTPHLGSDVPIQSMVHRGGPLLENLKLLGTESARINAEFVKLRNRYKWRTFGVFPANQTAATKLLPYLADTAEEYTGWESVPEYISIVEEASARADMDEFSVISGVDHFTISRSSTSFAYLISFLRKIKEEEEEYASQLQRSFGLHTKILDLDDRVGDVIKALQLEDAEPLRLALVGIDGIGKSTLAKQVVNVIRHQFEYICHVELEGVDRSRRIKQLEGQVAENLCYPNGRRVGIDKGKQPWFLIRGKKVLMIIDDVDSEDEISEFLTHNWCGEGSRLIITSSRQDWSELIVHQVRSLSEEASYQLLVTYLDETVLRFIPRELMLKVVDECDGLPLLLEIIGKYLRNKRDKNIWSGAVKRLQTEDSIDGRSGGNVLWRKLHVSFQSLAELEKSIFLDLATFDFFPPEGRPYDLQIFKNAWGANSDREVVEVALVNLEERSFLFLEAENHPKAILSKCHFRIHKQLRHMGRRISRPEKQNPEDCRWISQLSDLESLLINCKASRPKTEVLSIGMENKKTVHAGSESQSQNIGLPVKWTCMSHFMALRLLRISNMHFTASDELKFPPNLALLHMENCTRIPRKENRWLPFRRVSSWPLGDEDIEKLGTLCVLIIENCSFVQLPQNFHMLRNLEVLLMHCGEIPMGPLPKNMGFLPALKQLLLNVPVKRLPSSLLRLPALQSWELSGEDLQAWPTPLTYVDPNSHLKFLKELRLKDLPSLVELPDTFGGLASLEDLTMEGCSALKKLPEGFGALSKLTRLSIQDCSRLEMLCESFSSLSQLRRLTLASLPKLKTLPVTMGNLSSLEDVMFDGCNAVKVLPENFGSLQSILYLKILNCNELRCLPKSLEQLKSLQYLRVGCCSKFSYSPHSLLHLTSVTRIDIFDTARYKDDGVDENERELPESLKQISSLCTLNLDDSQKLPVSVELSSPLKELDSHSSARFAGAVDSASCLRGLKLLGSQAYGDMSGAHRSLVQSSSSTSSRVEEYTKSAGKPGVGESGSVGRLSDLSDLELSDCKLTASFMRRLGPLRELRLERCRVTDILETTMLYTGMTYLRITDCQTFTTLPNSLGNLTLLTDLTLGDCHDLVSLPETIGQLTSLRTLEITRCRKLKCLPESLGQLRNLHEMAIQDCRSMSTLPDFLRHMGWLKTLDILCQSFSSLLNPFENLITLTKLNLVDCQDLISIPDSIGKDRKLLQIDMSSGIHKAIDIFTPFRDIKLFRIDLSASISG